MFGTYVSPALVDQMVDSGEEPKLGGVVENITAYFSDIESFSTMSERLTPTLLVELMNEYLTACTDILQEGGRHAGQVHRGRGPHDLRGAAGAPGPCAQGVRRRPAGPEAQSANSGPSGRPEGGQVARDHPPPPGPDRAQLGPRRRRQHGQPHAFQLHHDGRRREHRRPHGERRQELGRVHDVHGGDPRRSARRSSRDGCCSGRSAGSWSRDARRPCRSSSWSRWRRTPRTGCASASRSFEQGLARYHARDWDGAIALFRQSEVLEVNGPGRTTGARYNPSLIYIGIAEGYRAEPPPPDWDGVYVMTEK